MRINKLSKGEIVEVYGGLNSTNSSSNSEVQQRDWVSAGNAIGMMLGVYYGVYRTQDYWFGIEATIYGVKFFDVRILGISSVIYLAMVTGSRLAAGMVRGLQGIN